MAETQEKAQRIAAEGFPCQGCGSQMIFEPEAQSMCCIHCGKQEPVPADMLEAPEYLYDPHTDSYTAPDWEAVGTRTVRCQGCGAARWHTGVCPGSMPADIQEGGDQA